MPKREKAPLGSPCWADLWTSDTEGSRRFYGEVLGWEAANPDPVFEGYFMFNLNGVPVAGAMGEMGGQTPTDTWRIYLDTPDIAETVQMAEAAGAKVILPPMPVADLGTQSVLIDPTGAELGAWQAVTFPGFTVMNENGAPSWFELYTRDHSSAVEFYRSVFKWETAAIGETHDFRYTVMRDPSAAGELAGIMDASSFLPEGTPSHWTVYWEVDDMKKTVDKLKSLGGSVVAEPEDTPYGRLAGVADPAGAQFKLRTPPR